MKQTEKLNATQPVVTERVKQLSPMEAQEEKRALAQKNLRAMCERDREKVEGIFHFYECKGGTLSFSFKAYKWDEVETYKLVDGERYTIPLGVAKHLNKNGWYPIHKNMVDKDGKPMVRMTSKENRFGFQSLQFIDQDEIGESGASKIVTLSAI